MYQICLYIDGWDKPDHESTHKGGFKEVKNVLINWFSAARSLKSTQPNKHI